MTSAVIISRLLDWSKPFTGKDNVQRVRCEVEFKIPYTTKNNALGYDYIKGDYFIPDTPQERASLEAMVGREVQINFYFSVRDYDSPTKGKKFFQDCKIHKIYDHES